MEALAVTSGVSEGVRFAWSEELVGSRVGYYPREEGNRVQPHSERYWATVETLPRERLEEIQLRRLQTLLQHTQANSAFYQRLWKSAGVVAEDVQRLEDLQAFPIVTKEHFDRDQREHPPFGSAWTVPPNEQMKVWQTSGTSGPPRLWVETKEDWENNMYLYARALYAHGVRPGWRAYSAFSYPPFIAFWLAHYASEMMGCQVVPKGALPTQVWLSVMQRLAGTAPAFMWATPTYAQRQIEVAAQMGLDPKTLGIKLLSLAGEPGACVPATKSALESAWGAVVHDVMGATESSGPILFTCEAQAALPRPSDHATVDYLIVEVLDLATHQPVPEGEYGALCVTALGRSGTPAVRFLLNDYVRLIWDACPCGRTLPLVTGGIHSRADDMLIIKGVNVYPSLIENIVRSVKGLGTEYLIVRGEGSAVVRVEAVSEVSADVYQALAAEVQAQIRAGTTLSLPVEVLAPGALPRSETKTKRIQ